MQPTPIEWTDFSSNPLKFRDADGKVVWACVHASPGCMNCYSEQLAHRYGRGGPFNVPTMAALTPFLDEKELRSMLTYKPASGKKCFPFDMTDLFGEWVSDEIIDRVFAVFALRGHVTWQVLTKRADRMRRYFAEPVTRRNAILAHAIRIADEVDGRPEGGLLQAAFLLEELWEKGKYWPLPNVWLGVSVESPPFLKRIDELLQTPAAVRFVSLEPLLADLGNIGRYLRPVCQIADCEDGCAGTIDGCLIPKHLRRALDFVIVGGESGAGARPFDVAWARSIVRQCAAAKVACFMKQCGANVRDRNDAGFEGDTPTSWPMDTDIDDHPNGFREEYQGAPVRVRLKDRKGGAPEEWPEDLRVREFPEARP